MDAAANKQRVIEAWETFATRDPVRVGAVFTPDAEWLAPRENATALALDGTHHLIGRERIVRFLTSEFHGASWFREPRRKPADSA